MTASPVMFEKSDNRSACANLQPASSALPCDYYHHYYHYQSSAQYLWLAETLCALEKKDEASRAYDSSLFQDHFNADAAEGKRLLMLDTPRMRFIPHYDKHPLFDADFCASTGQQPDEATTQHDKAAALYAIADYEAALTILSPDAPHSNTRFLIGKCLYRQQRYEAAQEHLTEAIRISHEFHSQYHRYASHQHQLRGEKFFSEGEMELAIADFTKALDLDRNNADAKLTRGKAYYAKGNFRLAQEDGVSGA